MAKSFEPTFIKKTFFVLIILSLFFLVTEIVARTFIFAITKDYKSFLYGFNKNIKIDINHLTPLEALSWIQKLKDTKHGEDDE